MSFKTALLFTKTKWNMNSVNLTKFQAIWQFIAALAMGCTWKVSPPAYKIRSVTWNSSYSSLWSKLIINSKIIITQPRLWIYKHLKNLKYPSPKRNFSMSLGFICSQVISLIETHFSFGRVYLMGVWNKPFLNICIISLFI